MHTGSQQAALPENRAPKNHAARASPLPHMASVRPMQLDGQYAMAQLWKLDTFKGHTIPLSAMLAEYLMPPQFPSARFRAWIEQYDRLPRLTARVMFHLLGHEEFPQHLSEDAWVKCNVLGIIYGELTWITYRGSVAQYLSQREAVFNGIVPTALTVIDPLTDEEKAYFAEWRNHYARSSWPLVGMRGAHPQLRGLYDRNRAHHDAWFEAQPALPGNGDYLMVEYFNGEEVFRMTRREELEFEDV